jgi:hypothetical protein
MATATTGHPFEDGAHAFNRGLARTRSPYTQGTSAHAEWLRGWMLAEQRDEEDLAQIGVAHFQPAAFQHLSP